jgi:hypothetical protein
MKCIKCRTDYSEKASLNFGQSFRVGIVGAEIKVSMTAHRDALLKAQ